MDRKCQRCRKRVVWLGYGRIPKFCSASCRFKSRNERLASAPLDEGAVVVQLVVPAREYAQLDIGHCTRCGAERWLYADPHALDMPACGPCITAQNLQRFLGRSAA